MHPRRHVRLLAAFAGLTFGVLAIAVPTGAQTASGTTEPAKVTKEGYFTADIDGAIPAALTNEFPPGIICILRPEACSQQAQQITGPIDDATPDPDSPDYQSPQPVEPNTLPVSLVGGKPRYTSYLQFDLPSIPPGSMVNRFDLILTETGASYALESPAFRQAFLAALVTYQNRNPEQITKLVADVAGTTTPLATTKITGVELCSVTGDWAGQASQDSATQPPRDCILGANGARDNATKTWTFDLSFLVQAYVDGTAPNKGVYLGPLGAENLAFGDPDTSTNWQVSFAGKGAAEAARPKIRYDIGEGLVEETVDVGGTEDLGAPVEDFGTGSGDGTVASVDPFAAPVSEVALGSAPTATTGGVALTERAVQRRPVSSPKTPWWLWLLIPLGAALAVAYERSLEEDPTVTARRPGALSRLVALRQSTAPGA